MKTTLSIIALVLAIIIVVFIILLKLLSSKEETQLRNKKAKVLMIGITICSIIIFIIQIVTFYLN